MRKGVINAIYVVLILVVIGLMVYSFFFAPERDYDGIVKGALILIGCILSLTGKKKRRYIPNTKLYEEQYKDIISGAFKEDKASYRKLMEAIAGYNFDDYKNAHRKLEQLVKNCKSVRDYSAVYMFDALCYMEEKDYSQAVDAYEKLLRYDMANSLAWCNLSVCYMKVGNRDKALEALTSALRYDPMNGETHGDVGFLYLCMGNREAALEHALRGLELNSKATLAMKTAALIYRYEGDEEKARKYKEMYLANGGKEAELEKDYVSVF